jgi:antitoxin YefM
MIARSYSDVRQNFKEYCDKAVDDFETIIITRERGENVVLISEDEYNNMQEHLSIMSKPEYYNELLESIKQIENGKAKKRDLLNE